MSILTRLKIGPRLMLGFAGVLALTVIVGAFSINRIGVVNSATADIFNNWLVATRALGEYRASINAIRRSEANHLLLHKSEDLDNEEKRIAERKQKAQDEWKRYTATANSDEELALVKEIESNQQAYYQALDKMLAVSRAGGDHDDAATEMYLNVTRAPFNAVLDSVIKDVEFQAKGAEAAFKDSQDTYSSTRIAVIGLLLAALAVGAVLAWLITRSITAPIAQAVKVAETVAAGDLTSDVRSHSADETGQLLTALKAMNDSLVSIVGQVRNSSDSIATGSSQIAVGNADLSQRTEEQASNLQQTAASMEQLTQTVKQNADTARQATQLAGSASNAAMQGGTVVDQVVATMGEISDSSRKISDIIGVIDGIAFQTNILALNAAVEAARAGEQGRGFAVVASEVRSLAQRSASAAKEIKTLIGASVQKVENGSKLVHEAGQSMNEIVAQVKRVNDLINEISASSVEQSTGIGQIGDAVSQLDQVTQQNAALVEESAAAAESLKHQAANLAQTVAVFKLSGIQQAVVPAPVHHATPTSIKTKAAPRAAAKTSTAATPAVVATAAAASSDDWTSF